MVFFRERALFVLRDKGGGSSTRQRSLPVILRLNERWRSREPLVLRVSRSGENHARIEADGAPLVETLSADAGGADPLAVARVWADSIRQSFQAEGRPVATIGEEP